MAPLTKLLPLIVNVCVLFAAGTGLGSTPLTEGVAAIFTVK